MNNFTGKYIKASRYKYSNFKALPHSKVSMKLTDIVNTVITHLTIGEICCGVSTITGLFGVGDLDFELNLSPLNDLDLDLDGLLGASVSMKTSLDRSFSR
jgi:hypothetical protein